MPRRSSPSPHSPDTDKVDSGCRETGFDQRLASQRQRAGLDDLDDADHAQHRKHKSAASSFGLAMRILSELIAIPLVLGTFGWLADRLFSTHLLLTFIATALGFIIAIYTVAKTIQNTEF